jgi:uncharacterized membrane protein
MDSQILYVGDTALKGAAGYLAGVMSYCGITFEYRASDERIESELLECGFKAAVISDYPSANFASGQLHRLAKRVHEGMGLLMIGGWESFHGAGGDYDVTVLGEVLPVKIQSCDDRINCPQPCLVEQNCPHPAIAGLPFDTNTPGIGGYNRVATKPGALEVLSARRFSVRRSGQDYSFVPDQRADPLLVFGSYGEGRVAAYSSDVAPHWVGGLVDWGDKRVAACAADANAIEVGEQYARFFSQVIRWIARIE